jgi:hypothetical protein
MPLPKAITLPSAMTPLMAPPFSSASVPVVVASVHVLVSVP